MCLGPQKFFVVDLRPFSCSIRTGSFESGVRKIFSEAAPKMAPRGGSSFAEIVRPSPLLPFVFVGTAVMTGGLIRTGVTAPDRPGFSRRCFSFSFGGVTAKLFGSCRRLLRKRSEIVLVLRFNFANKVGFDQAFETLLSQTWTSQLPFFAGLF